MKIAKIFNMRLWSDSKLAMFSLLLMALCHFLVYKYFSISYTLSSDHTEFSYVYLSELKRSVMNLTFPFWNPTMFFGIPTGLTGNYDPKVLPFLYFLNPIDSMVLFGSLSLLSTSLMFFYLCNSCLRVSSWASFVGAVFWAYSGYFVWYLYDNGGTTAFFWMPFFLICLLKFNENKLLYFCAMIFGVVNQLVTIRLQEIEVANLSVIAAYLIISKYLYEIQERKKIIVPLVYFFFSLIFALLLIMPFTYESLHMILNSARVGEGMSSNQCNFSIPTFFIFFLGLENFVDVKPGCLSYLYIGSSVVLLAVLGLLIQKTKKLYFWLLAVPLIVALVINKIEILGINLFDVYKRLPGHNGIRYSIRFIPTFNFFVMIAIAMSFDKIKYLSADKIKWFKKLFYVCLILNVLYLFIVLTKGANWTSIFNIEVLVLLSTLTQIFSLILLFFIFKEKFKKFSFLFLGILIFFNSYLLNWSISPNSHPHDYFNKIHASEDLNNIYEMLKKDTEFKQFRLMCEGIHNHGVCQYFAAKGVPLVGGYFPLISKDRAYFFNQIFNAELYWTLQIHATKINKNLFYLTNAKYWIHHRDEVNNLKYIDIEGFEKIYESDVHNIVVYRLKDFLPRFRFAANAENLSAVDAKEKIIEKANAQVDWFDQNIFVQELVGPSKFNERSMAKIEEIIFKPNQFKLKISSPQNEYLVVNDYISDRNWDAYVDGKKVEILRGNYLFAVIPVAKNSELVELKYSLPSWTWYTAVFFLLIFLFLIILSVKQARRT